MEMSITLFLITRLDAQMELISSPDQLHNLGISGKKPSINQPAKASDGSLIQKRGRRACPPGVASEGRMRRTWDGLSAGPVQGLSGPWGRYMDQDESGERAQDDMMACHQADN